VIVVQVRQQDRRDAVQARSGLRHRPGPAQDAHPIPQKRIGEQADVVQVEKHGRVAQPCDLHRGIHFTLMITQSFLYNAIFSPTRWC
jgi:hypothetical protein